MISLLFTIRHYRRSPAGQWRVDFQPYFLSVYSTHSIGHVIPTWPIQVDLK